MACQMDIIISDFDNTLFKRYHGLLWPVVRYLEQRNYPVYIVTYRDKSQLDFISQTLGETNLRVVGYGFAESRSKDPATKMFIVDKLLEKHNIIEALDDDYDVAVGYMRRGIKVIQ